MKKITKKIRPIFFFFAALPIYGDALNDAHLTLKMSPPAIDEALQNQTFEGGVEGLFPIRGTIRSSERITFRWRGKKISGDKPIFVFFEEGKKHQIFPIAPEAKELILKPSFQRHYCHWYLGRLVDGKPIAQSRVYSFRLLNIKEAAALKNDWLQSEKRYFKTMEAKDFFLAQIDYQYHLYHEMVDRLLWVYARNRAPEVKLLLFLGNVKLGRLNEAKKFR